jgi:hypothetical protein
LPGGAIEPRYEGVSPLPGEDRTVAIARDRAAAQPFDSGNETIRVTQSVIYCGAGEHSRLSISARLRTTAIETMVAPRTFAAFS